MRKDNERRLALAQNVLGPDWDVVIDEQGRAGVEIVNQETGEIIAHYLIESSGEKINLDEIAALNLDKQVAELSTRFAGIYVPPEPPLLVKRACAHPPRCLSELRTMLQPSAPISMPQLEELACLALSCPCGSAELMVIGHAADDDFLGPLGVQCPACGKQAHLIDPQTDGYNGEIKCNSVRTGEGPKRNFQCACGTESFRLVAGFTYQGLSEDEMEPEQWAHIEDFFDCFFLEGTCTRCDVSTSIVGWELA